MRTVIATNTGGAEPHQHFAVRTEFDDLQTLGAILADGPVRHPDVAVPVDMQSMRKHEHPGADRTDRFARRDIQLIDRRQGRSVAAVGAASVDGPDLIMRT